MISSEKKKPILTEEFVLKSIKKYNEYGEISKDVKLKEIINTLNIKEKSYVNKYNLNVEKVKETEDFIQDLYFKRIQFLNSNKKISRNIFTDNLSLKISNKTLGTKFKLCLLDNKYIDIKRIGNILFCLNDKNHRNEIKVKKLNELSVIKTFRKYQKYPLFS